MTDKKEIYIYNSLTRKKEKFVPLRKNEIRMYVCGPTVYDESHIGHARGAFIFDVVKNYLTYRKYKVTYVRNVTDVDDKIIDKAREIAEEGRDLKDTVRYVAEKYLKRYTEDMQALGIGKPDIEPKATEHIKDMLKVIRGLIDKGYAYEAGGDIYFRVRKFKGYGKLSGQSLKKIEAGARVAPGEYKEDPLDFALWKKSKQDEPSWRDGDIEGRPGWHIECSAMSTNKLGDTFDIHGGGIDLIFPHHENEIAQSEAYSEKPFARYWMHNGLLTIRGEKMAKSLGNYLSIADFLKRYSDADILKLFFLSTHYRSPIDFSEENIKSATAARERFSIFFDKTEDFISRNKNGRSDREKYKREKKKLVEELESEFEKGMDNDFNTAYSLASLFDVGVNNGYYALEKRKDWSDAEKAEYLDELVRKIKQFGSILDLRFAEKNIPEEFSKMVKDKLRVREEARGNRDFKKADKIRDDLASLGVIIEDTRTGTKWRVR
ncbi:MAG: cysteine--tRNA ligase [Candidatus Omnitrophica bacterium]|nr:cysteine--tRNA ligase [Candidatus Omnitrophota bacterium]